jgi:ABC-type uncharacterized transport system substrate-binding protein
MTRRRIGLLVPLALGLLVAALAVAQQPSTRATIGVLSPGFPEPEASDDAFRHELHARGWVEGQNLTIEYRFAQGQYERLPALAAELVRLQVNVIAAFSAPAIRAATQATTAIPIVFETLADAVAMEFVPNLVRPGGNITGVTGFAPELGGKWLELLREVVPGASHIAALTNPTNPNTPSIVSATESAARALGVRLSIVEVQDASALDHTFATMASKSIAALIVPPEPLFSQQRRRIADLASTSRLPTISGMEPLTEAGGLLSYGPTLVDTWRRAAVYVDRILRGATPRDLPVERPTTFKLVINLKTAEALGLTIPPTLLFQADEIIR